MPTIITGALASDVVLDTNQMPDNDAFLYLLKPYQSQLFQKLYFSERPSEEVIDAKGAFTYFEDELYPYQSLLSAAITGGGATENIYAKLTNPTYFQQDDILLVELTEQLVYVSTYTAGSAVTITAMDGTNITAAASGYLKKLGSRNPEYNTPRIATATQEVAITNYLTIFNESVEMTSREQGAKHFTNGRTYDEQVQKRVEEMKQMFERNLMLSTSSGRVTTGASPVTWGKGFLGTVVTNKISYTNVTEDSLDAFLQGVFDTGGSDSRDFYLGSNLTTAVNKILKDKYQITAIPAKEYGVDLSRYLTPFGMVNVYWNPRLDGKFTNYGLAVDWENIKMRYMANDTKGTQKFRIEEDVQAIGASSQKCKIYADLGIEIPNEVKHGIFYK
jgi:hypothetical protein